MVRVLTALKERRWRLLIFAVVTSDEIILKMGHGKRNAFTTCIYKELI